MLIVAVVGTLYAVWLGNTLRYPDERDYYAIATNLATTGHFSLDGHTSTAFRAPGYPMLLAAVAVVQPSIVVMRLLNVAALVLALVSLGRILRRHGPPLAALIATFLATAYPLFFYTAGTLYPQTVAGCLLLTALDCITGAMRGRDYVWGGLLLGVLILTVPTTLVVLPLLVVWLWFDRRPLLRNLTILIACAILVIIPWTVRNYVVFDTFVVISSNSGLNLLLGNSEHTSPNSGVNVDVSQYEVITKHMNEIERDTFYRNAALDYIRGHKIRTVTLYLQKFVNYFNIRNDLWTTSEASRFNDLVVLMTYGPLLLVTIARITLTKRIPLSNIELLLLLLYVANGLFAALFFTRIRFRLPFDLLLISNTAIVLATLLMSSSRRNKSSH